jgi:hypothetical protein
MLNLYFGSLFSIITTILVLAMLIFIVHTFKTRSSVNKWGRLIILFIIVGTAISAFSALRDNYAAADALFSMTSLQSNLCSIAGGAIFLTGIISIFLRNQSLRKVCFFIISALFICQVLVIEMSRVVIL